MLKAYSTGYAFMKIDILTLFPEMFSPLKSSIIGRAVENGILDIRITDIRDYSEDKHHKCDDYPFGGGAGMVMLPQPIYSAVNAVDPKHNSLRIYMSPKGKNAIFYCFADIMRGLISAYWICALTAKFQ